MNAFGIIFFSLALNMDALGVGFSYGIRKIKLPLSSILVICFISMASLSTSMLAGHVIEHYLTETMSQHIGGVILILLGAWAIYQYFRQNDQPLAEDQKELLSDHVPNITTLFEIRFLGVLIQVLKDPQIADADKSGTISTYESLMLGMALALDSVGAGVAISLLGYNIPLTSLCVGLCQFVFMKCGVIAGSKLSHSTVGRHIAILPGLVLVMIGMSRFY